MLGGEVAVPCHPQSALAGLNSRSRGFAFGASTPDRGVDGRVPRGERSRTRSDPGGSSHKYFTSVCLMGTTAQLGERLPCKQEVVPFDIVDKMDY